MCIRDSGRGGPADTEGAQIDRHNAGATGRQAIDIAADVDRLRSQIGGSQTAGAGAVGDQRNGCATAFGTGAAGVDTDMEAGVVSCLWPQQIECATSGDWRAVGADTGVKTLREAVVGRSIGNRCV